MHGTRFSELYALSHLSVLCALCLQGEIFAAEGYAKTTGRVGVCIATSGPGATNLVTGLADAMMDSVPLVAITGQVCGCCCGAVAAAAWLYHGWVQGLGHLD